MKVLWIVNVVPTEVTDRLGIHTEVLGGWVESMIRQLRSKKDLELAVVCKTNIEQGFDEKIDRIQYYSLYYNSKTKYEVLVNECKNIVCKFNPDLIQIEGTEFLHAKAMLDVAKEKSIPTVVSMQGILNGYYQYQCGLLPISDMMFSKSITNIYAAWMLLLRKKLWFKPRMKAEREIIESAQYILGRTTWDRAHAYSINPAAKYYPCNRILRLPFYETNWSLEKIERHSIYVGNGYSALKGVHYVIMALPLLIREYPDIKVYVAGYKPYNDNDRRSVLKKGYAAYLRKLIKDLNVEKHVEFTGALKANEVANRLARVNAYVLCSTIENSPNTLGEAMMVGTPCVAAYVGGVSDMATDGKEALLYRCADPALLAWNIKRIFDDDKLALELSRNGKNKAYKTHDEKENAEKLMYAYQEIMKDVKNAK